MRFETAEQEREYLCRLKEGERVVEEGNSGTTGWQGVTVMGSRGMCVKWDNLIDGGQMTTAVTHGTRRIRDVDCPFVQGIIAWGANLSLTEDVTPKSEAERICMSIERETIKELICRLKRAKATLVASAVPPTQPVITKCKRCGQVVGEFPKSKYCPYGSDPDGKNSHKYEKVASAAMTESKEPE